jgi:AMP deaminase
MGEDGVFHVYETEKAKERHRHVDKVPSYKEFYNDLDYVLTCTSLGPTKSFAFRRLRYLESKFHMYVLLNDYQEVAVCKKVPHRDFYNVRKVDTHVHHSSCMNQKHLLRFIKYKLRTAPNVTIFSFLLLGHCHF